MSNSNGVAVANQLVEILTRLAHSKTEKKEVEKHSWASAKQLNKATWLLGMFQLVLIIFYGIFGGSEIIPADGAGSGTQAYNMFIGVEIMMFVGFGYLMTFMKWYGLGAVGFTMLVTAMGLQWAVFTESFMHQILHNTHHWHLVEINMYSLLDALYAISAVLISFGALIGKITPLQLVTLTIVELVCHSLNFEILMKGVMHLADMGGTYSDHMFGAYFGLSVAYMLGKPKTSPQMGTVPDTFALIGTVFLWIYWPSFVAGAAEADSAEQQRALVNTILALAACTVMTFWANSVLAEDKKYRPVDIQNATLAGGVAIGCTANLTLSAFSAVMIGISSGLVSTFGYHKIQPYLEEKFNLHDTCGVHNLHAMPSVVGAAASIIITGYKSYGDRAHDTAIFGEYANSQWWRQFVAIFLCIGFAVFSGLITGYFLRFLAPTEADNLKEFHDQPWWETAEDYDTSFYSDLMAVVKDVEKTNNVRISGSSDVESAISQWSSHHGRRVEPTKHESGHEKVAQVELPHAIHAAPVHHDENKA